jgi:hypothetical protein
LLLRVDARGATLRSIFLHSVAVVIVKYLILHTSPVLLKTFGARFHETFPRLGTLT